MKKKIASETSYIFFYPNNVEVSKEYVLITIKQATVTKLMNLYNNDFIQISLEINTTIRNHTEN
jgi:hypothetical protein